MTCLTFTWVEDEVRVLGFAQIGRAFRHVSVEVFARLLPDRSRLLRHEHFSQILA